MAKLGEYLGSLFNSVSDARVNADLNTVLLAEEYARHQLLKNFAIPRMRINDVKLTIPVVIEQSPEYVETTELVPISSGPFKEGVKREARAVLKIKSFPKKATERLNADLTVFTDKLKRDIGVYGLPKAISAFSKGVVSTIKHLYEERKLTVAKDKPPNFRELSSRIVKFANKNVTGVSSKTNLTKLEVIAEAHRLREYRPQDIVQIEMQIHEDSMEWHFIENENGDIEPTLLPE